jgi:hypothetical protein
VILLELFSSLQQTQGYLLWYVSGYVLNILETIDVPVPRAAKYVIPVP